MGARPGQLCRPPSPEQIQHMIDLRLGTGLPPQRVVAEKLGVSRRTVVRWLARPGVREAARDQHLQRLYPNGIPAYVRNL